MQEIQVHQLDSFPIVKHYLDQLEVYSLFENHLTESSPIHASSLCVLITNIIISVHPLYKISEWLGNYTDGQSEYGYESRLFNDDRLGESLDILYKSDRHNLMSALSVKAIEQYELETDQIHNDSTSISLSGDYLTCSLSGESKGVTPRKGYNKDGRPDAKQILFNLDVTADGYVPIWGQWYDGNVSDSDTHQPNWNALRDLLGKTDFLYIADSKVSTQQNLAYLHHHQGKFISILPATRKEVKTFKAKLQAGKQVPKWKEILRKPHSRKQDQEVIYQSTEVTTTQEGYALHWIHSSAKAAKEKKQRDKRITQIEKDLEATQKKLNTYYLKTSEQIKARVSQILGEDTAFFTVQIKEIRQTVPVKIGRGRIGKNSQFTSQILTNYKLEWTINPGAIEAKARLDGIFPLVTNTELEVLQVLTKYKEQPYLEKRFSTLKSITQIVPVWLKLPHRIEAMLFLYFIALMVIALIERAIRKQMQEQAVENLPMLPQKMKTCKPTWNNIRYFFKQVFFVVIQQQGKIQQIIVKGLSKLHQTILELLNIPKNLYHIQNLDWWKFNPV